MWKATFSVPLLLVVIQRQSVKCLASDKSLVKVCLVCRFLQVPGIVLYPGLT